MHTMNLGGVERSLLGLLNYFDYENYEVDLFIHNHEGELLDEIPPQVNILPQINFYSLLTKPIIEAVKSFNVSIIFSKIISHIRKSVARKTLDILPDKADSFQHVYLFEAANFFAPQITSKKYDAVISFLHPNHFETSKISAKKYIGWVHTDYSMLNIDIKAEIEMWKKFDKIVHVSSAGLLSYANIFPQFRDKLIIIENILNADYILRKSIAHEVNDEIKVNANESVFLTIGRFSFAKNMDGIAEIAAEMLSLGMKFKWYLIGYGKDEDLIKSKISEFAMENNVILLGKKDNPYPYIKKCDIYIQPSRFEGKAVTVREAQILHKPVVITSFPTSPSQLKDGFDGVIVSNLASKCASEIFNLVSEERKISNIIKNLKKNDYSNANEVERLYAELNN